MEMDVNTTNRGSSHGGTQAEFEDCLCQPIIMEEVQWPLGKMR